MSQSLCRSDPVPASAFRSSPHYDGYCRPIRMEYAMAVPLHVAGVVVGLRGGDHGAHERALMASIRRHLGHLCRLEQRLREARAAWGAPALQAAARPAPLTQREREVMAWLSGGKTDRDIATILGISRRTVHKHLQRVYEKLGVETRTAAVARWRAAAPVL